MIPPNERSKKQDCPRQEVARLNHDVGKSLSLNPTNITVSYWLGRLSFKQGFVAVSIILRKASDGRRHFQRARLANRCSGRRKRNRVCNKHGGNHQGDKKLHHVNRETTIGFFQQEQQEQQGRPIDRGFVRCGDRDDEMAFWQQEHHLLLPDAISISAKHAKSIFRSYVH